MKLKKAYDLKLIFCIFNLILNCEGRFSFECVCSTLNCACFPRMGKKAVLKKNQHLELHSILNHFEIGHYPSWTLKFGLKLPRGIISFVVVCFLVESGMSFVYV